MLACSVGIQQGIEVPLRLVGFAGPWHASAESGGGR